MLTPRLKPHPRPLQTSSDQRRDWKENPLIIAMGTFASTAIFFMTVVVPLRVDLLTAKVEKLTNITTEARATEEKLQRVEKQLLEVRADLQLATAKNPLLDRSVYPVGLDLVVLGTPAAEVLKKYPDAQWDDENSYFSVKSSENSGVREATYSFSGENDQRKVAFILFHLRGGNQVAREVVRKHLLSTFGEPTQVRRGALLWKATDREWVMLEPGLPFGGSYIVFQPNSLMVHSQFDERGKK